MVFLTTLLRTEILLAQDNQQGMEKKTTNSNKVETPDSIFESEMKEEDRQAPPIIQASPITPEVENEHAVGSENSEIENEVEAEEKVEINPELNADKDSYTDSEENKQKETDRLVEVEYSDDSNTIEINYQPENRTSYIARRGRWSGIYSFSFEPIRPTKFKSLIDAEAYSGAFSGKQLQIAQLSIGTKFNFIAGGLTAEFIGGQGTLNVEKDGVSRSLMLTKQGFGLGFILDSMFSEPYIAPYFNLQMTKFDYQEKSNETKKSGTTKFSNTTTFGILLQLNSLEPGLSQESFAKHGLNNTFLDIFASKYSASGDSLDPNLETGLNYGAGLKLEF